MSKSNQLSFAFEGEYRRRPEQSLGGRRNTESRHEVVKRAQEDRQKRDRERKIANATVVFQSVFRSFLVRVHFKRQRREEFDRNLKDVYTEEELGKQLTLINYFLSTKEDNTRFNEISRILLTNRNSVVDKCLQDPMWALRIRLFLRQSFKFNEDSIYPNYIRLLEEYTDFMDYSEANLIRLSYIWMELIFKAKFFMSWRERMERRCYPLKSPYTDMSSYPLNVSLMTILSRAVNIVSFFPRLCQLTPIIKYGTGNKRKAFFCGTDIAMDALKEFMRGFAVNVIPNRRGVPPKKGIGTFCVLPSFREQDFPLSFWINTLENDDLDVNTEEGRHVLYSTLALASPERVWEMGYNFFRGISTLVRFMDPVNNPRPVSMVEDEEMDDDSGICYGPFDTNRFKEYWSQIKLIGNALISLLNGKSLITWLETDLLLNWGALYRVISCLARLPKELHLDNMEFLSAIAFHKRIMETLYKHVDSVQPQNCCPDYGEGTVEAEQLFVFCTLFNILLRTLHDSEFMDSLPMDRYQFVQFVHYVKELYAHIHLHSKDDRVDGLVHSLTKLLATTLSLVHDRNTRLFLFSVDTFVSRQLGGQLPVQNHDLLFADFAQFRSVEDPLDIDLTDYKLLKVLEQFPFVISFEERATAWHRLIDVDRTKRYSPYGHRDHIQIRRTHIYEDAFEKLSSENVPDLRDNIRISLVNIVGAQEAGVDGGGLLREFLTEATRSGVNPNRGYFRLDSQNRIYPNTLAKKIDPNYNAHYFLMGRLVGKALYEQTLLELPFAPMFIQTCIYGTVENAVDYLATLDSDLQKNLLDLKTYEGDWNALGLDFTLTVEELDQKMVVELKPGGQAVSVDKSNVIEYIHLVADYKINKEMEEECRWFRAGLFNVVPLLRIFSWEEMQILISGSDKAIDIEDWMMYTNYIGGYGPEHPTIVMFWQVLRSFDEPSLRKLLKFVTSCSRPPILGFKDLVPNFGLQNAGVSDRLPTAATCMNLLKLPEFTNFDVLRDKLVYAINAQAGFELS